MLDLDEIKVEEVKGIVYITINRVTYVTPKNIFKIMLQHYAVTNATPLEEYKITPNM